jgi:hypothetical protein
MSNKAKLLFPMKGKCKIYVYSDGHAELILSDGQKVMIDAEDAERCKEHKWYFNNRAIRSTDGGNISLSRFIMNAGPNNIVKVIDGNIFNCRKENLTIITKSSSEPETIDIKSTEPIPNQIYMYEDKDYAELILRDKKTDSEIHVKIDLDDIDKVKEKYWTYNTVAIQSNNNGSVCLHRYLMNVSSKVFVKFKNGDRLDCRKSNLFITHNSNARYNETPTTTVTKSITKSESESISTAPKKNYNIIHTDKGYSVFYEYNGQTYDLGRYNSEEDAKQAIIKKINEVYRELDPLGLFNL